jgi:hypothetical protein
VLNEPNSDAIEHYKACTSGNAITAFALEVEAQSKSSGGREIKAIRSRLDTTGSVRARGRPRALGGIVDGRVHYCDPHSRDTAAFHTKLRSDEVRGEDAQATARGRPVE